MQYTQKLISQRNAGFTLLYAMLIISLLLIVSSSIMSILMKELRLSAFGRESQVAFYVAESGQECATHWALKNSFQSSGNVITCNNQSYTTVGGVDTFFIYYNDGVSCAEITVYPSTRLVESRGRNTCTAGATQVERGIQAIY